MTVREAYEKAKKSSFYDVSEIPYLVSCVDFGDFWGFGFSPESFENGGICYGYFAVPKSDGEVYIFNPTQNLSLLDKAVSISIDSVLNG